MYDIDFKDIVAIIQRDNELQSFLKEWNGEISDLYLKYLPSFESFLSQLPDSLKLDELEALLRKKPVGFRLLFSLRLSQFSDRYENGKVNPSYKSLSDFLRAELYQNHPDKINRLS